MKALECAPGEPIANIHRVDNIVIRPQPQRFSNPTRIPDPISQFRFGLISIPAQLPTLGVSDACHRWYGRPRLEDVFHPNVMSLMRCMVPGEVSAFRGADPRVSTWRHQMGSLALPDVTTLCSLRLNFPSRVRTRTAVTRRRHPP